MHRRVRIALLLVACLASQLCLTSAHAADWPMWRHDARRSAATDQVLPQQLRLEWVKELPPLEPAWPDQQKMQFDRNYEPVVLGWMLFFGSPRTDTLTALDTRTGQERWTFYADGPIRFAPVAWEGRVYFTSDDGHLYCLDAETGALEWRFRGGPSDRKLLGNKRLISTWPARGAPVIAGGRVYFAASIWPFMGIFIHALDARTGEVVWTNDGDGSMYIKQPHNTDSFAGIAPQGPLVFESERLLIPGGRSVPACYDPQTGKMLYYRLAENSKTGGGSAVAAVGKFFFNGGEAFDLPTGEHIGRFGREVALTEKAIYTFRDGQLRAYDPATSRIEVKETVDRRGRKRRNVIWNIDERWSVASPEVASLIKAGSRLYAAGPGKVWALDLPPTDATEPHVTWETEVPGNPVCLLAADDRLFAVTLEGGIYCFAADADRVKRYAAAKPGVVREDVWTERAAHILQETGARAGYCVAWGVGSGRLIDELVRQSELHVIAVEPDAAKVAAARRRWIAEGVYGRRVAVHQGSATTFPLPLYLSSLTVSEDLGDAGIEAGSAFAEKLVDRLRPHGGVAWLPVAADNRDELADAIRAAGRRDGDVELSWDDSYGHALVVRRGALAGEGRWTHEHADAANTRVSDDERVRVPLGLLWFGGSSHHGILPRHGHGPQPQLLDGRLVIEGIDMLRAVDIYTGRILWETSLPGVGDFFDNTSHQPGANASGTNYISTSDGIYVAYKRAGLRLDPATGRKMDEFTIPVAASGDGGPRRNRARKAAQADDAHEFERWGYINVVNDYLIAGVNPLVVEFEKDSPPKRGEDESLSSSKRLVVMDRHTGKVHWSADARHHFRHNAICVGGGRVYCIDHLSRGQVARLRRRGREPEHKSRLRVFDLASGEEVWNTDDAVFGTWLSYSAEHDVLVEAGRPNRDTLNDEPQGMRAYRAGDGTVLWHDEKYNGPAMIAGDRILMEGHGCELLTGKPLMRTDPLTLREVAWTWTRNYGCNTPMASKCLLTFRSGAAGYFDLLNDGGTGNFGGFRSSCTNNLVVAGGVLCAPDYTRTCICSYQNQTSVALVHMPEVEIWTDFPVNETEDLKSLGLNLGAPGHRRAPDGRLWLNEFVNAKVTHDPAFGFFGGHSSKIADSEGGFAWVAASGCRGIQSLEIDPKLGDDAGAPALYDVRLHFADPDNDEPRTRRFSVGLQGREVLTDLDIVDESGGRNVPLVKEFKGVRVDDTLVIQFTGDSSAEATAGTVPVLCGIELVATDAVRVGRRP